jgi:hypothetical protein
MKKLLFILSISAFFFACKKETEAPKVTTTNPTTTTDPNIAANKWIHEVMSSYYLWNDKMPSLANTNTSAKPTDYFYTLLHE